MILHVAYAPPSAWPRALATTHAGASSCQRHWEACWLCAQRVGAVWCDGRARVQASSAGLAFCFGRSREMRMHACMLCTHIHRLLYSNEPITPSHAPHARAQKSSSRRCLRASSMRALSNAMRAALRARCNQFCTYEPSTPRAARGFASQCLQRLLIRSASLTWRAAALALTLSARLLESIHAMLKRTCEGSGRRLRLRHLDEVGVG